MKIKTLIKAGLWSMAALVLAACTSEDTIEKNEQKQTEPRVVASFSGQFAAPTRQAKTRTTGKHVFHTDMKVAWSAGDRIWVKSIDGTWHRSEPAEFLTADHSRANFKLISGNYGFNPEVRYVGASADPTQVIIPQTQSQTTLGEFGHLGASGDCGTATAKGGGGDYEFELEHKAAYICFYPRIQNDALHHNVRLEQITIGDMYVERLGGLFDFSNQSIKDKSPLAGGTAVITLNTNSAPIPSATRNDTCFYIAIRPSNLLSLVVSFTIKDPTTNVTTAITHDTNWWFGSFEAGKIYDYTAWLDKDIKNYDVKYYMWDAVTDYWDGVSLPSVLTNGYTNSNYPQSGQPRYYNDFTLFPTEASRSCAICPNTNELLWYAQRGSPHWDTSTPWSMRGHLYEGGLWLLHRTNIPNFSSTIAPDGVTDYTKAGAPSVWYERQLSPSVPAKSDQHKYFFLPSTGYILDGQLHKVGDYADFWARTPSIHGVPIVGTHILFPFGKLMVADGCPRQYGFTIKAFD